MTSYEQRFQIVGRGVYSLAEAARLTRIPAGRIRRWTRGYDYVHDGERRHSPPVIAIDIPPVEGAPALTFADILEVRFLDAFRRHGVSWGTIRIAAERAREFLGQPHPFSSRVFKTDGRTILADIVTRLGDRHLLDIVKNQFAFEAVVAPSLYEGVEFDPEDMASRWWPLGTDRRVVVDPQRQFGAPIDPDSGVQTRILARAAIAEGDRAMVSRIYRVSESAVDDAVEFESALDLAA